MTIMLPQASFQATTLHPIPDVEDRPLWVWPIFYREKDIDYSILMEGVLDEIVCLPLDVRNSGSLVEVWTPSSARKRDRSEHGDYGDWIQHLGGIPGSKKGGFDAMGM
jgi:hypothetical protein